MVYRGTWGRDPEKKGEDVFPFGDFHVHSVVLYMEIVLCLSEGPPGTHIFVEIADFRGIPPRMYYRLVPRLLPS